MRRSLDEPVIATALARLAGADAARVCRYHGSGDGRQPVHTCYVPASDVRDDLLAAWGEHALSALDSYAATPEGLAAILGLDDRFVASLYPRLRAKLESEPVEDLRIDFEDGYGAPDDKREDDDAERTAAILGRWYSDGVAPFRAGIRFKSFDTPALLRRGLRTLDIFLTRLMDAQRALPAGLVLTFPKVAEVEQVEVLVGVLGELESRLGIPRGSLRFEIQIETPQSIVDSQGRIAPPRFITAGGGRVSGLHFGTYDYTAGLGLPAGSQHLAARACDFARHVMQVSAAGTGVSLSDGSTNVLPVGDAESVREGWRTHYRLVRRSLEHGFHAGWDLHPAQLVTRYTAVYAFHQETVDSDAARLSAYLARSGGSVLDEPATARALSASLVHAVDCGALDAASVPAMTGVGMSRLRKLAQQA